MTETLFIRLGSQAEDRIYWLIVADNKNNSQDIIASGELDNAQQLNELTSKAAQRQVKILVPSCDVLLKSLTVPAKSSRAMRLAAPYMLEDNLAEEVEQLFFAYADLAVDSQGNNCFTAIVAHRQMQQWLSWLADAKLYTKHIIADVLAMPYKVNNNDNIWSAIALGDDKQAQVIVRQDIWQGFTLDTNTWQLQCQLLANTATKQRKNTGEHKKDKPLPSVNIAAYSPLIDSEKIALTAMPEELPLALMASHYGHHLNGFNLLQGQYKVKEKRSHSKQQWLWVAGVAVFALLLSLVDKSVQLWQLNAEQQRVEQAIIASYQEAFPNTKRVRLSTIKSQLNRELALLGSLGDKQGFLALLAKLQPAFAKVPTLKPTSLKFDGKRGELRIQATAKDYQAFEQFRLALAHAKLAVKQGGQTNQGEQVIGSFSITDNGNHKPSKDAS